MKQLCLVALVVLTAAANVPAQGGEGAIKGSIADADGHAVPTSIPPATTSLLRFAADLRRRPDQSPGVLMADQISVALGLAPTTRFI
jgi:hypothetical protein